MEVKFVMEKETKNTVRYTELPEDGEAAVIGTLYVQKAALKKNFERLAGSGNPEYLYLDISAG